jgi:hypothetical protein
VHWGEGLVRLALLPWFILLLPVEQAVMPPVFSRRTFYAVDVAGQRGKKGLHKSAMDYVGLQKMKPERSEILQR